jgi:hypothetical protein
MSRQATRNVGLMRSAAYETQNRLLHGDMDSPRLSDQTPDRELFERAHRGQSSRYRVVKSSSKEEYSYVPRGLCRLTPLHAQMHSYLVIFYTRDVISLSLSISRSRAHSLPPSLPRSHTHTHTHTLRFVSYFSFLFLFLSFSLSCFPLSLSCSLIDFPSLSVSLSHAHTLSFSFLLSFSLSLQKKK